MACRERRLCGTAFFHFFDIYTTLWAVLYECGRTCNIWILQYYVNIHLSHHAHYQPTFVQMVCSDSFAISHNVVGHFQSVLLRFRMLKYVVLGDINKTTTQKEFRFYNYFCYNLDAGWRDTLRLLRSLESTRAICQCTGKSICANSSATNPTRVL